ncbi:MAG: SHOCT domain-containing protein [Chitinophagaceae bacterium]|nr:SHOCT domain-containing protein [Chitinophagaceae bacterium]
MPIERPNHQPEASQADELMKFAELKEKGLITDEEFEAKKKQILGL